MLLKLWRLRRWVAVGAAVALLVGVASVETSHSTVYSVASTEMLVDSPHSALANSEIDLTGYLARANVFARLITSSAALQYIGQQAGVPGNLIDANGPIETDGSPIATHPPSIIRNGINLPAAPTYKLSILQNPDLPTVDIYATAPNTRQAIALANGTVAGFAKFINQLDGSNVPLSKRVEVRQLGAATGGVVDSGASKKTAVLIFFLVLALWCFLGLFVSRLRAQLRAAKSAPEDVAAVRDYQLTPTHSPAVADARPVMNNSRRSATPAAAGAPSGPDRRNGNPSSSGRTGNGNGNGKSPNSGRKTRRSAKPRSGPSHEEDVRDEVGLRPES